MESRTQGEDRQGLMVDTTLRIGLAAVRNAPSVAERLETVKRFLGQAAAQDVAIVCFPEAYFPGLRGSTFRSRTTTSAASGRYWRRSAPRPSGTAWRPSWAWSGNPPPGSTTSRS